MSIRYVDETKIDWHFLCMYNFLCYNASSSGAFHLFWFFELVINIFSIDWLIIVSCHMWPITSSKRDISFSFILIREWTIHVALEEFKRCMASRRLTKKTRCIYVISVIVTTPTTMKRYEKRKKAATCMKAKQQSIHAHARTLSQRGRQEGRWHHKTVTKQSEKSARHMSFPAILHVFSSFPSSPALLGSCQCQTEHAPTTGPWHLMR
jgi:hypothetical protein